MNLRDMINEVLKDIDDYLSDSDITGWINRALDDLTPVAKYQKMSVVSLVATDKSILLPDDVEEIVLLTDDEQDYNEINLKDKTGCGYKKWGNVLSFQPVFDIDKDFTLYYYAKLPHLAADTDIPVIRSDFHDLLVLYATAKAKYKDEVMEMHQGTMQEYLERKRQYIAAVSSDNNEAYQVKLL
ncbi:MAG: hypothetical protein ABF649_00760 [Bacillus sp. (in: firmicutes)]